MKIRSQSGKFVKGSKTTIICQNCGTEVPTHPSRVSSRKFCDMRCKGAYMSKNLIGKNHPMWKGGTIKHAMGYIQVRIKKQYILEHRLVMEQYIGRKLLRSEDVHHINGIKNDNRIENLQLLTHKEHISLDNAQKGVKYWGKNKLCNDLTDWNEWNGFVPPATKKKIWTGRTCLIDQCVNPVKSRGLCKYHYHSFLHFTKKYLQSSS